MPGGPFRASAVEDTTFLATFTFDQGPNCVTEGWTSHDLSAQLDDYWHVDDFDGLGGGSYGRLFPLEGSKSLWCGTRPGTDPNTCAYSTPGYGNAWDQNFCTRICATVSGDVVVDYLVSWDVEPGYDYGYLEYDECDDDWKNFDTPVVYNGTGTGFVSDTLLAGSHSGQIRLRFNVSTDVAWSDHDGLWNTDGAMILDSLTVSDGTGVVLATELFEDEAIGDTGSDDWVTCNVSGYGDFAQLYPGINTLQKDPCRQEYSCLWDFVKGSPYDYSCGGHASQAVVPYEDAEGQYIHNAIHSPVIALMGEGTGVEFEWDVYADLPINSLVFYTIGYTSVVDGCPEPWARGFSYIYSTTAWWARGGVEMGDDVAPGATGVQLELRVRDMCPFWCGYYGNGECHTNAPLFDNVSAFRVTTTGPTLWCGAFHDAFATDGTITGTVRADQGSDIYEYTDPRMEFEDEIWLPTSDVTDGIATDPYTSFGPAAYLYVSVHPQGQPGKGGAALTDDSYRWPVVDSLTHNGDVWYKVRLDTFWFEPETRTFAWPGVFSADLNDNLFTPGDTVYYFASAQSNAPSSIVTYYTELTGGVSDMATVLDNPMDFTCLPAGGYLRGGDILLVEAYRPWSEDLYDSALEMLDIKDKVDRYRVLRPSTGQPNSLSGKCTNVYAQLLACYRKIIWSTGVLTVGNVSDGTIRKTDDFALLQTFVDNLPGPGGVYFTGDNIAEEWAGMSGASAIAFRSTFMNFTYDGGDHAATGVGYSPLMVGASGGMFDGTFGVDSLVAYGGCPGPVSRFDVLSPLGTSQLEASYRGGGTSQGAILSQRTINSLGNDVGVVLSGFRFNMIRDARPTGVPDRAEHLHAILSWLGTVLDSPVDAGTSGYRNTLAQNRPNPFNPVTTIEFTVRRAGPVTLRVYNVAGQLVRTLVDDQRRPGVMHQARWNGRNDGGQQVSSGVYFYKLVAQDFVKTRKMVLLK